MKGRPRKPTKLHILDGTYRDDRHSGDEPQPLAGVAKCPRHLNKDAKATWKELVRVLDGAGVLTQADQWTMERFCTSIARLRLAEAKIDQAAQEAESEDPLLAENAGKQIKRLYVIVQGETNVLRTLGAALGLSPSARSQLKINTTNNVSTGVPVRDRSKGPPPPSKKESA